MVSEGPRAGDPDHVDGTTPAAEPEAVEPPQPPRPEPGPPSVPPWERPIFVVAAPQPAPDESDEGPLFIVPAAQPVVEPAPVVEQAPVVESGQPVVEPAPDVVEAAQPVVEPPWPAEPAVPAAIPPAHPAPAEPTPVEPGPATWAPTWSRPAEPEAAWEEPEPRRRRWRPGCFTILLVFLAALIGGGIYAYQTRLVTPRLVLDAVGFGAAEVEFLSLRDDQIRVDLAPASQADTVPAALRLAPYELRTYRAVRPTRLAITLLGEDGASLGACTLDLRSGDRYQIVALPAAALVRTLGQTPGSGRDLLFAESGACR